MAEMLLVVGYRMSGEDVLPEERMTLFSEVNAHVGQRVILSSSEWQQIAFAAKMEMARIVRRNKAHRPNKRVQPTA